MKTEKERIAELIGLIKNGDKSAFDELYKLTSARAYFIALQITKNEHDAEDVLQESYIKTLERINDIDPENNFAAWFYQVVANKSKDFLKSKKLLVFSGEEEEILESLPDENPEFSPEENLDQEELREEVMAAIDELTAEKRTCLMMMYFGDMSVNEIAESLEVPVSTVKNRLFTARKDLKTKFEKKGITSLYSAAPIGVVIWALGKTSEAVSATFAASAASAAVLSGVSASAANGIAVASAGGAATTAATSTAAAAGAAGSAASTAAATGTGVAAKIAVMSVAQKVVAGVVTAGVVSGSTAGVATVVKHNHDKYERHTTTAAYVQEVTTAPSETFEFVYAEITTERGTTQTSAAELTAERPKREPTATTAEPGETRPEKTEPEEETDETRPVRKTTTRRDYFPNKSTTQMSTTLKQTTTSTTKKVTTTRETTTLKETTQAPATEKTTVPTTQETTQLTAAASATAIIAIIDANDEVVDTLTLTVPAQTEMTWEYLISLISDNGYEATSGVYGDSVGAVAQSGATYNFEAEL